ncbi:MAG: hypothetical protein QW343_04340 [Candidatus Norongarragalinales archaeon]
MKETTSKDQVFEALSNEYDICFYLEDLPTRFGQTRNHGKSIGGLENVETELR